MKEAGWGRHEVSTMEKKKAFKNRFSWQGDRAVGNPALGQKDEAGDFLRVAVQGIVIPGLLRVERFPCSTEVMQSSVVWTVKHPGAVDTG